ncbi:MAG: hypothetical protein AAB074_17625 [Planctomycetota bacterium]
MRTATPVVDAGGMLLVREGAEITAEILERLRSRKIPAVDILVGGGQPPSGTPLSVTDPDAALAALAHAFESVNGNPVMKALYEAASERIRAGRRP